MSLLVVETHPVQYHAPVYRALQNTHGIDVTVVYGSDFSVRGYRDKEFGSYFAWDSDLLEGYGTRFLSEVGKGGAPSFDAVDGKGLWRAISGVNPKALLLPGYSGALYRKAILLAPRLGCPLLFRAETTDHAAPRGAVKAWMRDRALDAFYSRCARLLYIGQRSRRHYERLGCPDDKLVFSPYCVDTGPFRCGEPERAEERAAGRAELNLAESQIAVLFSGKISH
ncbi:MAG TPA: glycosyltransferase, partial [Solibacterales bacterium]|nr:glycosyltransferase [Bryobacterales bacterium]